MATALSTDLHDCRTAYSETLEALAETDERIVAVVNDSVGSSKLGGFGKRFPERLVNVGIAEQNMVGVGAGLANGGKVPFVSGAACFLSARALEQVKADLAYSNTNVKLCGMSSGVAYGELGPTHHSIEDMGWFRLLTNLTIIVPSDRWETREAIKAAVSNEGPMFIRVSRMPVPDLGRPDGSKFRIGVSEELRAGNDAAIIACGTMVSRALEAAQVMAAEGIDVRVINMATVNPLDHDAVLAAAGTGAVVTVEEHSVRGGLGGAVAEVLSTERPCHMRILGFEGFQPTGTAEFLLERAGLTAEGIAGAVRAVMAARDGK
ncbi:transketolase family protein [Solirhodobacter olei]|uniref:transketolase family protein n=1 Tax=Solirhodobacter olei TaxID=2493082 RepID=UPI000FDA088B|nr:transketolase C-terminal domain-containing protein [Solirhodobacter olei]